MMAIICLLCLCLSLLSNFSVCCGKSILIMSKSMPVNDQPLVLKYESGVDITDEINFFLGTKLQGACFKLSVGGDCGSGLNHNVTRVSSKVITLEIVSFNGTVHSGVWKVQEGLNLYSNYFNLTAPFGTIVTNSSINTANALPTEEQIKLKKYFNVSVTIGCAYPVVNVSWVFDDQVLTAVISKNDTGCVSPQVQTIAVLTLNDQSVNGHVNVSVRLQHPSFENEVRDIQLGVADFPDAISSTPSPSVSSDCQCDWCVYFACIQAIFLVLVIIIVLAFVLSIKLKYKWLLCVLHGSINIILGLSCAILLAQYDTCLQCKHDACVAAAVFCVTSLLGGIILIIVVILKYTGSKKNLVIS